MSKEKLPEEDEFQGWSLNQAEMGVTIKHTTGEGKKAVEEVLRGKPY